MGGNLTAKFEPCHSGFLPLPSCLPAAAADRAPPGSTSQGGRPGAGRAPTQGAEDHRGPSKGVRKDVACVPAGQALAGFVPLPPPPVCKRGRAHVALRRRESFATTWAAHRGGGGGRSGWGGREPRGFLILPPPLQRHRSFTERRSCCSRPRKRHGPRGDPQRQDRFCVGILSWWVRRESSHHARLASRSSSSSRLCSHMRGARGCCAMVALLRSHLFPNCAPAALPSFLRASQVTPPPRQTPPP